MIEIFQRGKAQKEQKHQFRKIGKDAFIKQEEITMKKEKLNEKSLVELKI